MNKNVMSCYLEGWKKTFVYKGNATRKDFWLFIMINLAIILFIFVGGYFLLDALSPDGVCIFDLLVPLVFCLYLVLTVFTPLILFLPVLSLGIRRMHDIGLSGWWFGPLFTMQCILTDVIYYVAANHSYKSNSQDALIIIYFSLRIIVPVILLCLCCMPTKKRTTDLVF